MTPDPADAPTRTGREFRKKTVVIQAVQWTGVNVDEVLGFIETEGMARRIKGGMGDQSRNGIEIETLEGTMRADPMDWIIRGVKGEFYPCKPDIFAATYEPVEQAASPSSPQISLLIAELHRYGFLRATHPHFAHVADTCDAAAKALTEQAATLQRLREQQEKLVETLTVEANRPMPSDAAFDVEVKEHAHGYRMGVGKALMLLKGLA